MLKICQIGCFIICCLSSTAFAQWNLIYDDSSIHFISIKKSTIAETHYFKNIKGVINDEGKVSVNIDLTSVETNIELRNDRMRAILFETTFFPKAFIKSNVDLAKIDQMKAGDSISKEIALTLSLHGILQHLTANVQITKLLNDRIMASARAPIILHINDFELMPGLEALRYLAKLPSISTIVPVSFNLVFKKSTK